MDKKFRPISLCAVLYKIMAKCLVNHVTPMLGEFIPQNQSAFILGHLITGKALIAVNVYIT
jgi:hypothetical protein